MTRDEAIAMAADFIAFELEFTTYRRKVDADRVAEMMTLLTGKTWRVETNADTTPIRYYIVP